MAKIALNGFGRLGKLAMGTGIIPLVMPDRKSLKIDKEVLDTLKSDYGIEPNPEIIKSEPLGSTDLNEFKVKLTQVDSLDPFGDAEKEAEARRQFNKVFGFLKDVDIPKQYIAIKFKKSNLSKSQRDRLLAYMTIRANNDPKYKEMVDKLDELIAKGLKVGHKNENPNNS